MKYDGIKEVKSICYPNDYLYVKKKSNILNIIIINLVICLIVAVTVIAAKYFGGRAEEVLNVISDALNNTAI